MTKIKVENVSVRYPTPLSGLRRGSAGEPSPSIAGELSIESLGKVTLNALNDISFSLQSGDRLGIIGSNGSGKTTLLRVMAGLLAPSAGRVVVEGKISTMFSMGVGMNMEASGYRNIKLSGLMSGASSSEIRRAIPQIEDFTELGEYLHLPMHTYSQGMAMRLKFACATAFQPEIVMLDEWIGAGDEDFQKKAEAKLTKLLDKSGIVVLATHNIKLMQRVATTVLWLEKGFFVGMGPTNELLDKRAAYRKRVRVNQD